MANYYAVEFPTFQRAMRNVLSISQDFPCVVVTTLDGINPASHDYSTGLIVRLYVPKSCQMEISNDNTYVIEVINATSFSCPLDTTNLNAFVLPPVSTVQPFSPYASTPATVVPVGEINNLLSQATQNVLPY